MKNVTSILNKICIAVLLTVTAMFFSCKDDIDVVNKTVKKDSPTITVRDFVSTYTDSALIEMKMEAPLMLHYGKMKEVYSDFPEGIIVWFYDANNEPNGHLSAKHGRYFDNTELWEVRDSVVAVNENNEMLETELLYWDNAKDIIYTDKFVRITQEDKIIRGYGMESDPKFMKWTIKKVTATFYLDDE